jgi:hypothetical protein
MSTTNKIILFLGMILTLGLICFVVYTQHQLSLRQNAIQNEQVTQHQLIDNIVRSQTSWATKQDMDNLLIVNGINTQALKAIQDDMDSLKATLITANVVQFNSQGQVIKGQPSSGTGPTNPNPPVTPPSGCPNCDPFGFMKAEQDFQLNEDFGNIKVPFGTIGFSAWQQNPWSVNIQPRQYTVNNIIGTDENHRNYIYNEVNIKEGDKIYKIPITSSTTKQVFPTAKFSFWNPRLLLGVDVGTNLNHVKNDFTPNVSLGIMSYGQYKTTPDFSVLEVGVGWQIVNQKPAVIVTPVSYNIGRNLFSPLMNNTYLGPSVSVATDGSWNVSLGLKVGF